MLKRAGPGGVGGVLQDAHAGELAAAYAYRGHWRSIRRDPLVRAEIARFEGAEWHHRSLVAAQLDELKARPRVQVGHEVFFGDQCRGHFLLPLATRFGGWAPSEPLPVADGS